MIITRVWLENAHGSVLGFGNAVLPDLGIGYIQIILQLFKLYMYVLLIFLYV